MVNVGNNCDIPYFHIKFSGGKGTDLQRDGSKEEREYYVTG